MSQGFPKQTASSAPPVVPALWESIRTHTEGLATAPTLDGVPAIAAYTHVAPFGWAVVVGAPQEIVFEPLRVAILRLVGLGAIVLAAGLLLALFASRGIMRPIEQLRRLAVHDNRLDPVASAATGLPETDVVARALLAAAAERRNVSGELAESEARFRALFEQSPSGAILHDPETTQVIDSNKVAAAVVGYEVEEFRGSRITDFALRTPPEQILALSRSVAAGATMRYETRVRGRRGPRDLLVAAAPVQVSGRTLVLLTHIDVTDLRRARSRTSRQ